MSRTLRPQQPRGTFHITSRTQGHVPWFTPEIAPRIADIIIEGIASAGYLLVAYAVMPNHFHLIAVQGARPWGWAMQPILRRTALLIQTHHYVQGHVFERRFRSTLCADVDHLRTAVLYVHRNPLKARICASIGEYAWTSHHLLMEAGSRPDTALAAVRWLFAKKKNRTDEELRTDYLEYLDWWCRKKDADENLQTFSEAPPPTDGTDQVFADRFAGVGYFSEPTLVDLRDHALQLLRRIDDKCEMELLRRSHVPRQAVKTREHLIAALASTGYRGTDIARFLRVHPSTVSRVSSQLRWKRKTQG